MEIFGIKISRGLLIMLVALVFVAFVFPLLLGGSRPDAYQQLEQQQKLLKNKATAAYDSLLLGLGIKDANLRSCVSRIMYDHSGNGLQEIGPDDVVNLYCPHQNISSAEGLNSFSNLLFLDLSNNSLSQIRFTAKQANLRQLKLSGNPISSIKGIDKLGSLALLRLPDMPKFSCKKLYNNFDELDHNLSRIQCQGENNAVVRGRDYLIEQQRMEREAKKTKSKKQKSNALTSRQERELLEYESRYGR